MIPAVWPASFSPPARPEIADSGFQRPGWTTPLDRDPHLLWLDKNENTDPALLAVVSRVLAKIDPHAASDYPDCSRLYRTLSSYLGVDPLSLVLAPGSDGVIGSVFRVFVMPGDVVIHTSPTYAMYAVYCSMSGAEEVRVGYQPGEARPYISAESMAREITVRQPKLVCLPNPDSPTGNAFPPDDLERLVAAAMKVGAMVLVDEAYHPFYPYSAIGLIARYPNVVVIRTFSKAWGLAGVRLGYGVAAPETAALLHKVAANYDVNMVAVEMAVRMIEEFESEMLASVRRLNEGRDRFVASMDQLKLRTIACETNFCLVAFDRFAEEAHAALGKMALYRKDFDDPCLRGFSRFTATTAGRFEPIIECVRSIVLNAERA